MWGKSGMVVSASVQRELCDLVVAFVCEAKMTVADLSRVSGHHRATLANVLGGQIPMSYGMAVRLRAAMGEIAEEVLRAGG